MQLTRQLFDAQWQAHLTADGRYKPDPRFTVRLHEPSSVVLGPVRIVVTFQEEPTSAGVIPPAVTFNTEDSASALNWMIQRPPPRGSLRVGNAIARVTKTLGIQPCDACKHRQLRLNK